MKLLNPITVDISNVYEIRDFKYVINKNTETTHIASHAFVSASIDVEIIDGKETVYEAVDSIEVEETYCKIERRTKMLWRPEDYYYVSKQPTNKICKECTRIFALQYAKNREKASK